MNGFVLTLGWVIVRNPLSNIRNHGCAIEPLTENISGWV